MEWCIFVQCTMNSAFIIVGGEFDEDLRQVGLCVPRTSSGMLKVKSGNIGDEGRQERGVL
jgi:hypothetical protein